MGSKSQVEPQSEGVTSEAPDRAVRIGVLSDTHGWIDSNIQEILASADCIVHAGDVLGASVLQTLERLAGQKQVVAVAGNNDIGGKASNGDDLPTVAEVQLPGGTLVVTHGDQFGAAPAHESLREAWPEARVIVYGHTHRLVCDQGTLPWVLNPGAAGRTRVHDGPSCLMLTIDGEDWTVAAHQFKPFGGG